MTSATEPDGLQLSTNIKRLGGEIDLSPPNHNEVEMFIADLEPGRALGPDGLTPEILENSDPLLAGLGGNFT